MLSVLFVKIITNDVCTFKCMKGLLEAPINIHVVSLIHVYIFYNITI